MLVLAAFVSISVAAILFLLRFLFAFFPAARRVPGRVEQVPAAHALGRSRVRTLDPGFTWLTSIPHGMLCMRLVLRPALVSHGNNSQAKECRQSYACQDGSDRNAIGVS